MQPVWEKALGVCPDTATVMRFEDKGQDCTWWACDGEGKVVDCGPFQQRIWVGMRVQDAALLLKGQRPRYINKDGDQRIVNWKVSAIEHRKGGKP